MQGRRIVQVAIVVLLATLMGGAVRAQCSGRRYNPRHHDREYAGAPAYHEVYAGHGGGYGRGYGYRRDYSHGRRHWGR